MNAKSPHELAQILIASGLASLESIKGCSEGEIAAVEAQFNVKLPAGYKDYLRVMGQEMGDFATDVIMTYPGIIKFCRPRGEKYAAKRGFELLNTHFVFLIREDVFMFFDCSLENPPVYRLDTVVDEKPIFVGNSFLDYLTSYVKDAVSIEHQSSGSC